MSKENINLESLTLKDILNKNRLRTLINKYYLLDTIIFHTWNDSMQIKLTIWDFLNCNHAIRETLSLYPNKKFYITTDEINEEYFDINDSFANDYICLANKWANHQSEYNLTKGLERETA